MKSIRTIKRGAYRQIHAATGSSAADGQSSQSKTSLEQTDSVRADNWLLNPRKIFSITTKRPGGASLTCALVSVVYAKHLVLIQGAIDLTVAENLSGEDRKSKIPEIPTVMNDEATPGVLFDAVTVHGDEGDGKIC